MFWQQSSTSNTSTTATGTGWGFGQVRIIIQQPMLAPAKCADQRFIEGALGRQFPPIRPDLCSRECVRTRRALEVFGCSPEVPLDPIQARKDYRAMAKAEHPDVGGDAERFKEIAAAWDLLKRRGFVG